MAKVHVVDGDCVEDCDEGLYRSSVRKPHASIVRGRRHICLLHVFAFREERASRQALLEFDSATVAP